MSTVVVSLFHVESANIIYGLVTTSGCLLTPFPANFALPVYARPLHTVECMIKPAYSSTICTYRVFFYVDSKPPVVGRLGVREINCLLTLGGVQEVVSKSDTIYLSLKRLEDSGDLRVVYSGVRIMIVSSLCT